MVDILYIFIAAYLANVLGRLTVELVLRKWPHVSK